MDIIRSTRTGFSADYCQLTACTSEHPVVAGISIAETSSIYARQGSSGLKSNNPYVSKSYDMVETVSSYVEKYITPAVGTCCWHCPTLYRDRKVSHSCHFRFLIIVALQIIPMQSTIFSLPSRHHVSRLDITILRGCSPSLSPDLSPTCPLLFLKASALWTASILKTIPFAITGLSSTSTNSTSQHPKLSIDFRWDLN